MPVTSLSIKFTVCIMFGNYVYLETRQDKAIKLLRTGVSNYFFWIFCIVAGELILCQISMSWPQHGGCCLAEDPLRPLGALILNDSIPAFINDQITKFSETFDRLSQMNPRMTLFIIRVCPFVPKFTFVLRCSHFWKFKYLLSSVDNMIRDTLIEILNCPLNDCSWFQASLSVRFDGLCQENFQRRSFLSFANNVPRRFGNIIKPSLGSVKLTYLIESRVMVWHSIHGNWANS